MAGRYTEKQDRWIVEFYDAVPTQQIAEDLNRSVAWVKKRAEFLKASGAWEAYEALTRAELKAGILAGRLDPERVEVIHGIAPEDL